MQAKTYPTDVLEQAKSTLTAVTEIDKTMTFGDINLAMLTNDITQFDPILTQIDKLETQLTDLRNQREALGIAMWDKIKRIRMGVRANYGDDSSQYEMVGGTRFSDRKPRVRKMTVKA